MYDIIFHGCNINLFVDVYYVSTMYDTCMIFHACIVYVWMCTKHDVIVHVCNMYLKMCAMYDVYFTCTGILHVFMMYNFMCDTISLTITLYVQYIIVFSYIIRENNDV